MKTLAAALALTTALTGMVHAEGITEFNIGILGGENAQDRLASNECFRQYVEDALGVPTHLYTPADYNGVIQGLLGGSLDFAWLGASGYAATYLADENAVEPVLVKTNVDGSFVYYSVGIAREDSGITSLEGAQGRRFGFGDPNSTSGYLIPSVEVPQAIGMPMEEYFGEVVFTGGHEQTIIAVNNGDIDAGVTWTDGQGNWEDGYNSGGLRRAVDAGLVDMNDLVEIWRSNPIPEGPVVLRSTLPQNVKDTVTNLLLNLGDTDADCLYGVAAGETAGFLPITHDYYNSIIEVRRQHMN